MEFMGLFSDLLIKYMEYMSSKKTGASPSRAKFFLTGKVPKYTESLSSYVSACQKDPELQSFDSSLHQRTIKLISSLTSRGVETEVLSLDSLMDVCEFLVGLSQDVVKIIIDSKEVVSKNQELKSLVDLYSENTTKTLNLFNTVEKCVDKADIIHLLIRVAIKEFETGSLDMDSTGNNKYAETLEKLKKVKALEDPFGDEFATQYDSVYGEQVKILEKIRELQVMFEKKHKNVKDLRRLGNIVFVTALFSVVALSLVTIPVAAAVAVGCTASATIGAAGTWVNGMLKDYEKAFKTQKDLFLLIENNTKVNIESMKAIKNLVETLIIRISSILQTVEVAVEQKREETVKLVMQEVIKKVEFLAEKIEEVGLTVAKCNKVVASGRVLVLEHIASSVSLKGKEISK